MNRSTMVLLRRAARGGWLTAEQRARAIRDLNVVLDDPRASRRVRDKALETLRVVADDSTGDAGLYNGE